MELGPQSIAHSSGLKASMEADEGRRPIGLVDGLCRLWERARQPLVHAWRAQHTRKYDYGVKGRSSTDAVWLQSLYDESAEVLGKTSSTVLLDLAKACESAPLEHVWGRGSRKGSRWGFSDCP